MTSVRTNAINKYSLVIALAIAITLTSWATIVFSDSPSTDWLAFVLVASSFWAGIIWIVLKRFSAPQPAWIALVVLGLGYVSELMTIAHARNKARSAVELIRARTADCKDVKCVLAGYRAPRNRLVF